MNKRVLSSSCWCLCMLKIVGDGWRWLKMVVCMSGHDIWRAKNCGLCELPLDARSGCVWRGKRAIRLLRGKAATFASNKFDPFIVTNTRTWCIDSNPLLFAWICPAMPCPNVLAFRSKLWCLHASLRSKRALSSSGPGSRLLQEVLWRQRPLRHWVLALA